MLGIEDIGYAISEGRIDNLGRANELNATVEFITEKLGFSQLAINTNNEQPSDMCIRAFLKLAERTKISLDDIDCVVVVTQNPDDRGLPHTSAIVHAKLNLPSSASCFDISLGCSGFAHGLSIVLGFLERNGFQRALLFTADPYSRIIDQQDRDTALLFGDAATCTLLSPEPRFLMEKSTFATKSEAASSIRISAESGRLIMNGNAVFRFVAKTVPEQIRICLERNGVPIEDIDLFLFHQGSKFIIDTLTEAMDIPKQKVPFISSGFGNTVSSSIPIMLQSCLTDPDFPRSVIIAGFGVGLSSCVSYLKRVR
ncbi:MAG: ketoacyl-ACP synthase III [Planctomycetaceae bacterium]|nr:ketoacyl-ACP synthase III [Planctomycetaceae bacterium]